MLSETLTNNKEVLAWDIYNTFKPIVNIYTATCKHVID